MTMIALIGLTEKKMIKSNYYDVILRNDNGWSFTSLDLMLFYVFGNLHLFQCFILLDFGEQKKDFMQQLNSFLYTFTGSLIMLIGILYFGYIYQQTTGVWSFNVLDWYSVILPFDVQLWLL